MKKVISVASDDSFFLSSQADYKKNSITTALYFSMIFWIWWYDVNIKIKKIVGYDGELVYDKTKPDGVQQKLMDISLLNKLGWQAKIGLDQGLRKTYDWFLENKSILRK